MKVLARPLLDFWHTSCDRISVPGFFPDKLERALRVSKLPTDDPRPRAQGIIERTDSPPAQDYEGWRRARLAVRLAMVRPDVWNNLITVVVHGLYSHSDALARTLTALRCQTYRNIEILLAGQTDLPNADDFVTLRGLFVMPGLDPLDLLSDSMTDQLWRGSHLVFAAAGTTFDADAFALLNRALSPPLGTATPDLVICDHDRIVTQATSPEPCFLPGWDPDLVCTMDYVGSAFMASRKLILQRRSSRRPASLHEWLATLGTGDAITVAHIAEPILHLLDDLPRPAPAAVTPERPARAVPVAIIIPNRDQPDLLRRCMGFLDFFDGPLVELIVVDHASTDPATLALYAEAESKNGARILRIPGSFNFSRMINLGVAATTAKVILLMNNDVEVTIPGQMETIIENAMRPEVGVAGARLLYPDGRVQHAGMLLQSGPDRLHRVMAQHVLRGAPGDADGYLSAQRTVRNYQAVTGALMATRRDVFESAGGFDEVSLPVEYNDVDYCLRVRALGLRVVAIPTDGIIHRESSTRGKEATPEVQAMRSHAMTVIADRWRDEIERDPFRKPFADLGDVSDVRFPWTVDNQ